MQDKKKHGYFTKTEIALWIGSVIFITVSFLLFDGQNYLTLAASLIGVSSLIFNAKGNPTGQVLMIVFSLVYGYISYGCAYYGEMITFLGMTLPMSVFSLISWLKNPYKGNRAQVKVSTVGRYETIFMLLLTAAVTGAFYFILDALGTASLIPSTVSLATSFAAAYLTFRRSPFFALGYAANDVILIVLWIIASLSDPKYISVVVCFFAFLFNDVYGYINWQRMKKKQALDS